MEITNLLKNYQFIRDIENEKLGPHKIVNPELLEGKMIRTLDDNFYRPLSPMLKERFQFCSSWENSYLSQNWLSLSEIENWEKNNKIVQWVELRCENSYQGEPLEDFPRKNIAIFSYNPCEPEEIYLIWDDYNEEPRIWHYFGSDFYTFNSLERFFLFINGKIGDEDTIRIKI